MKNAIYLLAIACSGVTLLTSCSNSVESSGDKSAVSITDTQNEMASFLIPLTEQQQQLRMLNSKYSVLDNSVALKNPVESGRLLYVKETNTTFWTDSKYLYQKTDNECFAIAEGIIYSLNLLNGKLYFICSDKSATVQPMRGTPYMLDLTTGELTLLSDKTTSNIYIQQERIFLKQWESYIDENGKTRGRYLYCQCNPDGTAAVLCDDIILCTNGDWYVTCEKEESVYNIYYRNDKENIKKAIAVESSLPKMASIYGDYFYFVEGSWGDIFKIVSLDSGETVVCDTKRQYINDYIIVDSIPALLTDMSFGIVNENMVFDGAYITYDDNRVKNYYSVYLYNNDIVITTQGGYQLLTKRNDENYFSSPYSLA